MLIEERLLCPARNMSDALTLPDRAAVVGSGTKFNLSYFNGMLDEWTEHKRLISRVDSTIATARWLAKAVAERRATATRQLEHLLERATFGPKSWQLFGLEQPPDGQPRERWREELL